MFGSIFIAHNKECDPLAHSVHLLHLSFVVGFCLLIYFFLNSAIMSQDQW